MRESSPHHNRARVLGLAAVAALVLAACSDMPTNAPGAEETPQERFQVIQTQSGESIVAGRVLVKFRSDEAAIRTASRLGTRVREMALDIGIMDVEPGHEVEVAEALSDDPSVVWAEPDYVQMLMAPPTDRYFGYKWGLHNDGSINNSTGGFVANTGAADADIDWLEAYESLSGASFTPTRIAILDTGIRHDHEDLGAKIVGEYDFFNGDGVAADDHGHGTHVAGISAGIGDNGVGITGVAWHAQATLLVAKVCGQINPFQYGCPSSGTANAIAWAADNGARVMNLSLGGSSGSSAQQDALQYALSRNALAFCATGNDNSVVSYPAAFPECVAVAATDWSDNRASYSNFGPQTEIAAPGGDDENASGYSYILSAGHGSATEYVFMAGTSMATPMATGLGGLLASIGVATADEIRSIMASTADDLGSAGRDDQFGHGRINAYAAVQAAGGGGDPDPTDNPPTASFTDSCADLSCTFDGSGSSDDNGISSYSWAFGDGATATGVTASHSYAAGGTYTVTLTVTDTNGQSDSQSRNVTVTEPSTGGLALSASGYKVKGVHHADLTWSGASSTSVDIYRNGSLVTTTANDGAHTDNIGNRGGGSYTYQVCEAGTSTCSSTVTVSF